MSTTTTNTTVRSLCPSWCTFEGAGHGFEELTDGSGFVRSHETTLATVGAATLYLSSDDRLDAAGLTLTHSAPYVTLSGPENLDLSAEGARALAAALVAAADRLDAVTVPGEVTRYLTPDGLLTLTATDDALTVRPPQGWTVEQRQAFGQAFGAWFDQATDAAQSRPGGRALAEQVAQQALTADPRPVVEGGQVVETWRCQQPDAAEVFLRQVFDIDGEDATILAEEPIRNGSGSIIGTRFTITVDAAEAIRAGIAAGVEASQG